MSLIPPSSQCPEPQCREVVVVCWANASGARHGCTIAPLSELGGTTPAISAEDTLLITGALWGAIAVAFGFRMIGKSLVK